MWRSQMMTSSFSTFQRNQFPPLTNRDLCSQLNSTLLLNPSSSRSSIKSPISHTPCLPPPKVLHPLILRQETAASPKNRQMSLSKQPRRMRAQSSSSSNRKSSSPRRIRLKMSLSMSWKWVFSIGALLLVWISLLIWISTTVWCARDQDADPYDR